MNRAEEIMNSGENTYILNKQHTYAGTVCLTPKAAARTTADENTSQVQAKSQVNAVCSRGCRGISPCLPALANASVTRESRLERTDTDRQEGKGWEEQRDEAPLHPQAVAGKQLTQTNNCHSCCPGLDSGWTRLRTLMVTGAPVTSAATQSPKSWLACRAASFTSPHQPPIRDLTGRSGLPRLFTSLVWIFIFNSTFNYAKGEKHQARTAISLAGRYRQRFLKRWKRSKTAVLQDFDSEDLLRRHRFSNDQQFGS